MNSTLTVGEIFTKVDDTVSALKHAVMSVEGKEREYSRYYHFVLHLYRDYISMLSNKLDRMSISNRKNDMW